METYIRAEVVEVQLGTSRALHVYSATERNLLGLVHLAILEVREFLLKVADVVGDVELANVSMMQSRARVCYQPCEGRPCPARGAHRRHASESRSTKWER